MNLPLPEQGRDLLARAATLGFFDTPQRRQTHQAHALMAEARGWLADAAEVLRNGPAGEALRLIDPYELIYRTVHRQSAPAGQLDAVVMRAFEAISKGDASIDQYILYRAIHRRIDRRIPAFMGAPLHWLVTIQQRWHRQICAGQQPPTLYDTEQQLLLLLESDLYAYEGSGQAAFKRQLFQKLQSLSPTASR